MEDIEGVAVRVVIIGKVSRREVPLTILGLRQYTCPDRCLPLSVTTIRGLHKLGLPTGLAFHRHSPAAQPSQLIALGLNPPAASFSLQLFLDNFQYSTNPAQPSPLIALDQNPPAA